MTDRAEALARSRKAGAEAVEAERAAQGLALGVEDPVTIERLRVLVDVRTPAQSGEAS